MGLFRASKRYGIIFGEMAKCDYNAFYKEMNGPKPEQDASDKEFADGIKYILVSRNAEFQDEDENELCEYIHVDGRNDEAEDGGRYGIEFTSISILADLPIKIDDTLQLRRSIGDDVFDKKVVLSCKKPLYLLDIIWGILWEISFFGSPASRNEKFDEIAGRLDDVKESIELGEPIGERFTSVADMMARFEAEIEVERYADDGVGPYGAD